jgi:RNA polymerase sigma-70 factor (ECF subfamily)
MTPWHPLRRLRCDSPKELGGSSHDATSAHAGAVDALIDAWSEPDARRVAALLTRRAILTIDTGGVVPGLAGTRMGRTAVASALLGLSRAHPHSALERREANSAPVIAIRSGGRIVAVVLLSKRGGAIDELWAVVNPDKLAHWNDG